MNLARAQSIAEKIRSELAGFCTRVEIAGSIRRRRPQVNDIDLVLEPRPGQVETIKARCEARCTRVTDGDKISIWRLRLPDNEIIQLDLYFTEPRTSDLFNTTPANFGSVLLCRTGSKEHNIFMVEQAAKLGRCWRPMLGVFDDSGLCLASETEEEIFQALNLDFIPPERRER